MLTKEQQVEFLTKSGIEWFLKYKELLNKIESHPCACDWLDNVVKEIYRFEINE